MVLRDSAEVANLLAVADRPIMSMRPVPDLTIKAGQNTFGGFRLPCGLGAQDS